MRTRSLRFLLFDERHVPCGIRLDELETSERCDPRSAEKVSVAIFPQALAQDPHVHFGASVFPHGVDEGAGYKRAFLVSFREGGERRLNAHDGDARLPGDILIGKMRDREPNFAHAAVESARCSYLVRIGMEVADPVKVRCRGSGDRETVERTHALMGPLLGGGEL